MFGTMSVGALKRAVGILTVACNSKEAKVVVNDDGIVMQNKHPSTTMADIRIDLDNFNIGREKRGFEIELEYMLGVLKSGYADDTIAIEHKENKLLCDLYDILFDIPVNTIDDIKFVKMNLLHNAKIRIKGRHFKAFVKAAFEAKPSYVVVSAENGMFKMFTKYGRYNVGIERKLHYDGDARSLFGIDYMYDLSKYIRNNDNITIEFGQDSPMHITFEYPYCSVSYWVSPRIESDQ